MKTLCYKQIFVLILLGLVQITGQAQWQRVYTNNAWANGTVLYVHGGVLFQVGSSGGTYQTLRSGDNGTTWTNITSSFPNDLVLHMLSFGNTVFAVLPTIIGQTTYSFYSSTDNGVSWSEKSTINRGAGNGAILSMASDGNNLFAISNKRSIYKSTNGGSAWTETIINYSGTSAILSFAASGNTYLAALEGVGSVLSTDAGLTWTLRNSTASISRVYKLNADIWGVGSGFSGIFRFNTSSNVWENNYLPTSFSSPKSIGGSATRLISCFGDFLTNGTKYYSSGDNGVNWTELTTDTIGLGNGIVSPYAVVANGSFYFVAYWKSANSVITSSLYRLPTTPTSVVGVDESTPGGFQLDQNYPNPFNPSTVIRFSIPAVSGKEHVRLRVFDVLGKEVAELVNTSLGKGSYAASFDGTGVGSGAYFYRLESGATVLTKRMLLVK